jgi:DNA-binding HxlR family transcriptional regulator
MRCRSCSPLPEEVRRVADLLERRWTVSILVASHEGAVRFNEFIQMLGPVPPATLASRLTGLERAGILERVVVDRAAAAGRVSAHRPRAAAGDDPRGTQSFALTD